MMKKEVIGKKRVAVLFGGKSTEHEVSLQSSVNLIQAFDRENYDITLIGVDKQGRWILCDEKNYLINADDPASIRIADSRDYLAIVPGQQKNQAQLIHLLSGHPLPDIDVVFSVLHGAIGEDGSMQGLFRVMNIPYVSSEILSSALCMDKDMSKRILSHAGIPVTPSVTLSREIDQSLNFDSIVATLGLPLFVKPVSQGSSVGVSKVIDRAGFEKALLLAFNFDVKVLVEQAIIGREIEVAVLGNENPKVSVCGEIFVHDEFYSYETKYFNDKSTELFIPAKLDPPLVQKIRQLARQAYLILGCSVMARVDFFLTREDSCLLLNEVNTLPGFTSMSMYPKLWEASGLSYSVLVDRLLELAMDRALLA